MQKDNNENVITLLDENGKEKDFEVISFLEVNESEYAILLPVDDQEGEAFIFKVVQVDGEDVLECVEDDEEFEAVAAAYEELENGYDEEEEEEH